MVAEAVSSQKVCSNGGFWSSRVRRCSLESAGFAVKAVSGQCVSMPF